jgi:hypothetical protein
VKNLKPKSFAFFLFGLFALCFVAVAIGTGARVTDIWTALKTAYKTIPLLLVLWTGFAAYAWKWRVFRGWLVPFPDLDGTWQGLIQTTWKHPETGETPGPIPVIVTIKQSFLRVSCVMRTAEMISRSYFADFWLDSDEQLRKIGYCYTSAPSPSVAERSQPHDGTMIFELVGDPVKKLKGIYWTTRKTTGEVALTWRSRERLGEFPTDLGEHPMKGQ